VRAYVHAYTALRQDARNLGRLSSEDSLVVLNLHSIAPNDPSAVDPGDLDRLLTWLRARCQLITFGQVNDVDPAEGPFAVLSFDDGYRDFVEYALPVLERHRVRANQNVVPGCVEADRPPWNVELLDALAQVPARRLARLSIPHVAVPTEIANVDAHRFAEVVTGHLKRLPKARRLEALHELRSKLPELDSVTPRPMMSTVQVREIARDHEIGLHSYHHDSMELESDDFFSEDTQRCREWYEACLGGSPTVYAFPNGSFRPPQPQMALDNGFHQVLLVGERSSPRSGPFFERVTMFGRDHRELRTRLARAC
jgi:peptidoglycan/xylan/chitin deacetylase (PgdA/CDA1 family)